MAGEWELAVDFGTTSTGVAKMVADGVPETVRVDGTAAFPSAVLLSEDGTLVCGREALGRTGSRVDLVTVNPKRRLGETAILLGDTPVSPTDLAATVLRYGYDAAIEQMAGTSPTSVTVTHPVRWGGRRRDALREAAAKAGLENVELVPEPVAAAAELTQNTNGEHSTIVVFDLGGGTLDIAALRKIDEGSFALIGSAGGLDDVGGEAFDDTLVHLVGAELARRDADVWERLRFDDDRAWRNAAAGLRLKVKEAKETLSSTQSYTMYLPAPIDEEIVLTRPQLESALEGDIRRAVDELSRTVEAAGLTMGDVDAVYLVGGSSRIPLVTRLIGDLSGTKPISQDDPKSVVARGSLRPEARLAETISLAAASGSVDQRSAKDLASGKRKSWVFAGIGVAALIVVLAGAGFVAARTRNGTTSDPGMAYSEAPSSYEGLAVAARWEVTPDGEAVFSERLTNPTDTTIDTVYAIVVPKSVATDASMIDMGDTAFIVLEQDPIIGVPVLLGPGETLTLTWRVRVENPQVDESELAVWAVERAKEREMALSLALAPNVIAMGADGEPTVPPSTGAIEETTTTVDDSTTTMGEDSTTTSGTGSTTTSQRNTGTTGTTGATGTTGTTAAPTTTKPATTTTKPATTTTQAPTTTTTQAPTTTTTPPVNQPPFIGDPGSQTIGETQPVNIGFTVSDPEGQAVTLSITGGSLPPGLALSGTSITGTTPHTTVGGYDQGATGSYSVTVTAMDAQGLTSSTTVSITVNNTHFAMPDYTGSWGDGSDGKPNVGGGVYTQSFDCSPGVAPADAGKIVAQTVSPGTIVPFKVAVTFTYGQETC